MAGFDNEVVYGSNVDFTGNTTVTGQVTTDGQLLIGSTVAPNIRVGTITSTSGTLTITNGHGTINIETAGGMAPAEHLTGNTGGTLNPDGSNNFNILGTGSILITGSGSTLTVNSNPPAGMSSNLGISYSGGTFTVTDASGNTLSALHTGYVTFQNNSSIGRTITMSIVNPYTFTDNAGSNEIGATLFGITTGIAWGNDCPFYLYAIINSAQTDVAFGIGRVPNLTVSPVAGNLGKSGSTLASTQGSLYLLKENTVAPTVANFASQPCVCLGSFRMQASSTPAWTVQTLSSTKDGIGNFNENTVFTYPTHQNGAVTGTHFGTVGGSTAPAWTSITAANYTIKKNGLLEYTLIYANQSGNGSGTDPFPPTFPLQALQGINMPVGWWASASTNASSMWCVSLNANTSQGVFKQHGLAGSVTCGAFVSGGATGQMNINLIYTVGIA